MKIKIKRFNKDIPLPEYKTPGAAAMDCYVREDVVIEGDGLGYIPLNVAVQVPKEHFVLVAARSSLHKRGLFLANGVGIGDEDFSGDDDEYHAAVYNFTKDKVEVKKGERLVQIMILPYDRVDIEEVDSFGRESRGGFGTTGK